MIVRELTGGIYFGERGRKNDDNYAFDTCQYSRDEIIRIAKMGFEYAEKRSKKLCCVDKANILETSRLWRETVQSMEKDYPSPIWVAMEYRYMPPISRLVDEVHSGKTLGNIISLSIREHRYPFLKKVGDWNRFNKNTGGTLV